jgi:hypothetical protein
MTEITAGEFNGMACCWLGNDQVRLAVTTERGPRIAFWGWREGTNLFAEVPEAVLATPAGPFHLLGGHRLWYAPEVLDRTYWPDNDPVMVAEIAGGAAFTTPVDGAGIVKQMTVAMAPERPEVTVTHTLRNSGRWAVQLAPWAISMCRTGGVALLPQPQEPTDAAGFLPNRRFSFWPYSDVTDPRLAAEHPDQGCNAEFFFAQDVIELESLGPLVQLEPGAQVTHEEVWHLQPAATPVETEDDAVAVTAALNLS